MVDEATIEKVAKALCRAEMMKDPELRTKYNRAVENNEVEKFVKILDQAIDHVWSLTNEDDEVEKKKFKTQALYALHSLGYELSEDQKSSVV